MTWHRIFGLGFLASIGFTMSMFVTSLAFDEPVSHVQAKVESSQLPLLVVWQDITCSK